MIKENSRKKNLLFVLHSFDILFSSGKSIEEAVGLIAKSHYGTISNDFSMIIAKTKNNYINIDSALLELKQKTKVKNYRLLLEYLAFSYKNNTNIQENIIKLQKKAMHEQQNMHKNYENLATTFLDVYILFSFVTVLILNVFVISTKMLGDNELFSYFGITVPSISPPAMFGFYFINSVILVAIAGYVYMANPNNK